jgi:hypothetical protein
LGPQEKKTVKTYVAGWTTLTENPPVLVREYKFGAGTANAMAVALPGDQWLIMSPPNQLSIAEVEGFNAVGRVVALVENNGSHHMGLGVGRACFAQAVTYAAPRAAARIRKKGKDFGQLEPTAALQPQLGEKVSLVEVDGDKIGDVVVHVRTERGNVFYAGDFIANLKELPQNFLFRLMFKLTDSAPGLKVFKMFFKFFVADAVAARRSLIREIRANAPTILVPAHGEVIEREDLAPTLIQMLEAAG